MEGMLLASGRFIAEKKRDLNLGFFKRPEYPFTDDGKYFEVDPIPQEYDLPLGSWERATDFVKENANKYCGCLGISSNKLIELIGNEEIYFELPFCVVEKWVIIYSNEHGERCVEYLDAPAMKLSTYDLWSKFKYLYCTNGGNPNTFKNFTPIEIIEYSKFRGRGISIAGSRSLLDEMMDKAVKHVADFIKEN